MARRVTQYEKRRNAILCWWALIALLIVWAWRDEPAQLWALPLLAWVYYQLLAVPTLCGVETTRGEPCKNPARGRLMACKAQPAHAVYKTDALLRLVGFRRPPRQPTAPVRSSGSGAPHYNEQSAPPAAVESRQTLMILLTLVGAVAGAVQTLFTVMG